jgi:molecular chaperone GrpE
MSEDEYNAESAPEAVVADARTETQADVTAQPDTPGNTPGDGAAPAQSAQADMRIADLERLLAAERDAATDYMQRWQRAVADFTNFKRRAQQEQAQRERLFAAQALAPVLNALDSFERAFATLPDTLRGYSWVDGLALVEYQLRRALDAQRITEVPAEPGQPFDPAHHQAIGEVETDQHPAGHIVTVLQRGYEAAGLLIRPALVQVARPPGVAETAGTAAGKPAATTATSATPEETQPSGPSP